MSKLNVDQKSVMQLFQDPKSDFLIPDYQRPYAWGETECQTLWDDVVDFAFPDMDKDKFKNTDEYYLGPIVTFKNDEGRMEVIDGQQRLTTLLLILRAFYNKFGDMKDKESASMRQNIEKCIWKADEFGIPDQKMLKIDSQVATDDVKVEFLNILSDGSAPESMKSRYAVNYRFFVKEIDKFLSTYPTYFSYLPARLMNKCILLPIEAESQDTALRIFSTLNDRGKPLSDADIFKSQLYKIYSGQGQKDAFITKWKDLEDTCEQIFHPTSGKPMDEIFTRYMYYERARKHIKDTTTEALRKFYEKNGYELLKQDGVFDNIIALADFWNDVAHQDQSRFSEAILKRLFVLNYAPNGMWTYLLSVWFIKNRDESGELPEEPLLEFLNKITAFVWAYAITNPGVNLLRTPAYPEMINIIKGDEVTFSNFRFDSNTLRSILKNFEFRNGRPITKSMLTWYAFNNEDQQILNLGDPFDIEHIYAKERAAKERTLKDIRSLEAIGNKSLLEKRINISASDYHFSDKKGYYLGHVKKGKEIPGTKIADLEKIGRQNDDFNEEDIIKRTDQIFDAFIDYLGANGLIK